MRPLFARIEKMIRTRLRPKNPLLSFLLGHLIVGTIGGGVLCTALLAFDVVHLRTLITASEDWLMWLIILFGSVCATFGSLAMGVGVMGLGDWSDRPDREY